MAVSARAQIITRRTYNRPLNDEGTAFETWNQTIDRVISGQRYLWENAQGGPLKPHQVAELEELRQLYLDRKSLPAGRTLWLGGTDLIKRRPASGFNCSFLQIKTVHDFVDFFWLLLQGCGVGFKPVTGTLSGFTRKMDVEIIRSTRTEKGGAQDNTEHYDPDNRVWTIVLGDSAEAWARSIGKLLAGKFPAKKLRIILEEIRPGGLRLKGYGWICSGDGPIAQAYVAIAAILNRKAGKLLSKIDIWDICNWLGTVLSSRRSAQIGLIDHGDPEYREVMSRKPPGFDNGPDWFKGQSNNSILFWDKPTKRQLRDLFDHMVSMGGSEPGFVNMREARRRAPWGEGLNPCLTAETKVYTADGRRDVTIGQLAAEGKDVPVFCVDKNNNLVIRMMRNPRLTGRQQKILKVTLDNGQSIRVTENHKFRLKSGGYCEAKELTPGTSLAVLGKYIPEQCNGESYADRYVTMLYQANQRFVEHREIAAFSSGREIVRGEHVHHKNENRLDNSPENLEICDGIAHITEHVTGENNPRHIDVSNEEIISHGRALVRELGRRFSILEWGEYAASKGIPVQFSEFRRKSLGSLVAFSKRCAMEESLESFNDIDPRVVRTYYEMIRFGFDAEIRDNLVFVTKQCEGCENSFSVEYSRREQGFCSHKCSQKHKTVDWASIRQKAAATHEKNKAGVREKQIAVYRDLNFNLGRRPMKSEWSQACKNKGVSPEISRKSSPFRFYSELVEQAEIANHKVISVVFDGDEDVYNGTVDDFHNFFVGGFDEGLTDGGRRKLVYINNLQCGEILLPDRGFCNICDNDVASFRDDNHGLHRAVYLNARANYRQTVVDFRDGILQESWHQNNQYLRLCGVGLTGIARRPDLSPYDYRQLRGTATYGTYSMADELGLERPKNTTTIKPSGTVSKIAGTTEGMHRPLGRYIINNVQFSEHDPVLRVLADAGYKITPHSKDKTARIVGLPHEWSDVDFGGDTVDRESAISQLERYRMLQNYWCDQNTSCTVSYDPSEIGDMVRWFDTYWDQYVGVSFLFRNDPTKTAADLGFEYLPQQVVTREIFEEYNRGLKDVDIDSVSTTGDFDTEEPGCATGACPVR